jgi:Flp pilus assembly protein TadD
VIAAHPDFPAARLNLASALMHQGDLSAAVDVLRQLTADEPRNAEAFYNLGVALKQQDDFEPAEEALRRAAALDAKMADAPFTLGVLLWQTGRSDEAEAAFRESLARNPQSADAHYMLATILRRRERVDEAVGHLRAAIGLRSDLAEAHQSLAQLLERQGDHDGARAAQEEADRLNKRTADSQASAFALSVGEQKLKDGDLEGAIAQFRQAISLLADNAKAHYALALALDRAGDAAAARRHFDEARKLSPHLGRPGDEP